MMRVSALVIALAVLMPATQALCCHGDDGEECLKKLRSNMEFTDWRTYFFTKDATVVALAQQELPGRDQWIDYSLEDSFVPSADGRYFFFVVPGFEIRQQSGAPVMVETAPDSFVYLYDRESGNASPVFQMGTAGSFHHAFWLDSWRLVILASEERDGLIVCVDTRNGVSWDYLVDARFRREGASDEEFIVKKNFRDDRFIWNTVE